MVTQIVQNILKIGLESLVVTLEMLFLLSVLKTLALFLALLRAPQSAY